MIQHCLVGFGWISFDLFCIGIGAQTNGSYENRLIQGWREGGGGGGGGGYGWRTLYFNIWYRDREWAWLLLRVLRNSSTKYVFHIPDTLYFKKFRIYFVSPVFLNVTIKHSTLLCKNIARAAGGRNWYKPAKLDQIDPISPQNRSKFSFVFSLFHFWNFYFIIWF